MYEPRRLLLISKATNFIAKLKTKELNTYTGEQTTMLLYLVDTMIYGLSSIDTEDWQVFLRAFKEAKYKIRTHSKDENIKKDNYETAVGSILQTLEKYVEYMETVPTESV